MTSDRQLNRTRLHTISLAVLGVTAAVTLTACGPGASPKAAEHTNKASASASPSAKGVVTPQQAAVIVDHYVKINNAANAKQDEDLLKTVEGGQLNVQSVADYEQWNTMRKKDQREYASGFNYIHRRYIIPSNADWFAVQATVDDTKTVCLLIFDRPDGKTWKNVFALGLPGKNPHLPAIATAGGLATAVNADTRAGVLAPNQVSGAYEDLFETGGTSEGTALDHTSSVAKDALKIYRERNTGKNAHYTTKKYTATTPRYTDIYALKLKDGGVLAVVPTAHTSTYALKPAYMMSYKINPADDEAVYNPSGRVAVVDDFQGMALAQLPTSGKARLLAREYRLVDSQ